MNPEERKQVALMGQALIDHAQDKPVEYFDGGWQLWVDKVRKPILDLMAMGRILRPKPVLKKRPITFSEIALPFYIRHKGAITIRSGNTFEVRNGEDCIYFNGNWYSIKDMVDKYEWATANGTKTADLKWNEFSVEELK